MSAPPSADLRHPLIRLLRAGTVLLALVAVVWSVPAAAKPSTEDKKAAKAALKEARGLERKRDFEAACEKYAESFALDPVLDVEVNLADCYQRIGKRGSAWKHFAEVEERAKKEGNHRWARVAKWRMNMLKGKVCHLVIAVAEPPEGLVVKLNGEEVAESSWGEATPIDRGSHEVEASAPGKKAWSKTVEVEGKGTEVTVEVPALEDEPVEEEQVEQVDTPKPVTNEPREEGPAREADPVQMTAGTTLTVFGVGGVGIGVALLAVSMSKASAAEEPCEEGDATCAQKSTELQEQADAGQIASIVSFAVGGSALVAGIVLMLTAQPGEGPDKPADDVASSLRILPTIGPNGAAMRLVGRW